MSLDNSGKARVVELTLAPAQAEYPVSCDVAANSRTVGSLIRQDSLVSRLFRTEPMRTKLTTGSKGSVVITRNKLRDTLTYAVIALSTMPMVYRASPGLGLRNFAGAQVWNPSSPHLARAGAENGVQVLSIGDNSVAARSGLRVSDIITKVNKTRIANVAAMMKAVDDAQGKPIDLEVVRDREVQRVTIKMN
jgi:S1-C subfamily serine protease